MPQRNLLIVLATIAVSYACYVRGEQNPYARFASGAVETIGSDGLENVPAKELYYGAMQGLVDVLHRHGDVHSEFLNEKDAEPLRAEIHQQFGGIGVRIRFVGDPPRLVIAAPPDPGSPAARANLLPGDHILAIDGESTEKMNMSDVLGRMRGQPGTMLTLDVRHEHEETSRTVELTREVIQVESILGDIHTADGKWQFTLPGEPRIALVRITSFGDRTADELAAVLERLMAGGIKAVVLDLRDNPGGALDAAVAVCDLFLPGGKTVVETRGRNRALRQRYTTTDGEKRFLNLPLAVLVNQNSASAAEIVAACLRDNGRAEVVGQRTYGKGTVQQLLPMESGRSLLKLTWANFWRPSGANIHRLPNAPESESWGVSPDPGLEVRLSPEEYAVFRRYRAARDLAGYDQQVDAPTPDADDEPVVPADFVDKQLEKAVDYLEAELAKPAHYEDFIGG